MLSFDSGMCVVCLSSSTLSSLGVTFHGIQETVLSNLPLHTSPWWFPSLTRRGFCIGALTSSGIHPDTSTDTGRAQNCLSPEDTSDKWKGAAPCYSSVRMPVTQLEACIQAVLPCHHHLEAVPESSEFLQNVVYNHLEQVPPL
ncbi:trafficking protein particle complex subunit 9-like [Vicugna pacos]|uniref:Trafficking protein particle complex subunit 9-like n=1 Tax=Vicugna pacos TaxID=30538 RepID=A0ABM5CZR4_VICPA